MLSSVCHWMPGAARNWKCLYYKQRPCQLRACVRFCAFAGLNFFAFKSKSMSINIQYVAFTGATPLPAAETRGMGGRETEADATRSTNPIMQRSIRHLMFALRNGIVRWMPRATFSPCLAPIFLSSACPFPLYPLQPLWLIVCVCEFFLACHMSDSSLEALSIAPCQHSFASLRCLFSILIK